MMKKDYAYKRHFGTQVSFSRHPCNKYIINENIINISSKMCYVYLLFMSFYLDELEPISPNTCQFFIHRS